MRDQLACYGSTSAFVRVLECNGGLYPWLNALSKDGRWADMTELVTDEMIESIAIVKRLYEIAGPIRAKVGGVADTVSPECTRRPDPGHFADICLSLQEGD